MMEADNTFSGIFGNKLSAPQKPESQSKQEDKPAIIEQTITAPTEDSGQKTIKEEHESNAAEKTVHKRGRRRKGYDSTDGSTADKAGHFSCICDKDLIAKVRAIAWQEHMTVRAVVESMFTKCTAKYEKKRGPIQIEPNRPSEELF
jgi:hypothetical protein